MTFTASTFLVLVLNWWVAFSWRTKTDWTFDLFLVLLCWSIAQYMLAIFLYPPDLAESDRYREIFDRNRLGYYGASIVYGTLDIVATGMRGALLHPVWYLPFAGSYLGLCALGMLLRRRSYDRFFAWYLFVILFAWCFFVRRILVNV